ncbi:MAG: iron ABC transporter permease [Rhodothermaceae bacterium]|nr:iron ABC transporter permease [Rhodothermaceae bacterium]
MKSTWIPTLILVFTSFLVIIGGVVLGPTIYSFQEILQVITSKMGFTNNQLDNATTTIVWQIRLPRVLLAYLVGAGLSLIGLAMQTLVRNPLAEPYILGIASGASAGASLFYLGFLPPFISVALTLPLAAFLGSLFTMVLVLFISYKDGELQITRLLLAGVALASLMGAVSTFATFASPDLEKMKTVMFWLLGSFSGSRWDLVLLPALATLLALAFLLIFNRPLDALLLGEESAHHLGVPVQLFRWLLIGLAALVTGLLVAAAGAIGFVGLIIPHSIRAVVGVLHRKVVPLCFFAGGIFMVLADVASRTILPGEELPIGMITALCGAPFFLWLLRKNPYRFGQ